MGDQPKPASNGGQKDPAFRWIVGTAITFVGLLITVLGAVAGGSRWASSIESRMDRLESLNTLVERMAAAQAALDVLAAEIDKTRDAVSRAESQERHFVASAEKAGDALVRAQERSNRAESLAQSLDRRLRDAATELRAIENFDLAEPFLRNPALVQALADRLEPLPVGSVIAVDARDGCPTPGWQTFTAGAGRVIVGVGAGAGLTPRAWQNLGGEEAVTLTPDQMPPHNHTVWGNNVPGPVGVFYARDSQQKGRNRGAVDTSYRNIAPGTGFSEAKNIDQGGGRPHENMPPYIALYLCKKI